MTNFINMFYFHVNEFEEVLFIYLKFFSSRPNFFFFSSFWNFFFPWLCAQNFIENTTINFLQKILPQKHQLGINFFFFFS